MALTNINIPELGEVAVSENKYTGKLAIKINNKIAYLVNRKMKTYEVKFDEANKVQFSIKKEKGNSYIKYNGNRYQFKTTFNLLFYVLCVVPFLATIVIGNLPFLPQLGFYFVGGAIGGLIGALCSGVAYELVSKFEKTVIRLIIVISALIIAFGLCWGIGTLIALFVK